MLNRHISFTLALRYLNPLRAYFSIISLICLMGVSLGVMVLVVVLSIMSGLIKDLQDRILAFSPHLQITHCYPDYQSPEEGAMARGLIFDWEDASKELEKVPGVEAAYALIEDNALVDAAGMRRPSFFRAIDTENRKQLAELESLIDQGSFDLDMGEKAVIASTTAKTLRVGVGDKIGILTLRNVDGITSAYTQSETDLLVQRFPDQIDVLRQFPTAAAVSDKGESWALERIEQVDHVLLELRSQKGVRDTEQNLLSSLTDLLYEPAGEPEAGAPVLYAKGTAGKWSETVGLLTSLNRDQEDLASLRNIKSLVLPKDLEIIGIYKASQHIISPDLFIPLGIGQELEDFTDNGVQHIALRVSDPYHMDEVIGGVKKALPPLEAPESWLVETWQEKYSQWFRLMQQEKGMMNFVLSFISLISAFCIMAVMFTVSIQRKKELAVMKALGATPWQVIRVFLWQGVVIGLLGALIGVGLGLLVLHYRTPIHGLLIGIGFDPFPSDFHGMEMPAEIRPGELVYQGVKAFLMVVVASIVPAVITAYQDPAKALRSL